MIQPNRLKSPIVSIEYSLVAFLKSFFFQKEKYIDYFKSLLQTTPCSSKHKMSLSSGCQSAVQTWSALDFLARLANQWAHLFPSLEVWPTLHLAKISEGSKKIPNGINKKPIRRFLLPQNIYNPLNIRLDREFCYTQVNDTFLYGHKEFIGPAATTL